MTSPSKVLVGYCCWTPSKDMEAELLVEWGAVDELLHDLVHDQQVIIIIMLIIIIVIFVHFNINMTNKPESTRAPGRHCWLRQELFML